MPKGKTGLVLSGGGGRGAYQIGVWQALREKDIQISVVTGTSVGALNGALIAQGDYEKAVNIWAEITSKKIMDFEPKGDVFTKKGQFQITKAVAEKAIREKCIDQTPLKKLIQTHLLPEKIISSKIDFGLTAATYPALRPVRLFADEIAPEKLVDYLMASSACFPFFKPYSFDGNSYIDGGYIDYIPISLALSKKPNAIIAVDLKAPGFRRPVFRSDVPVTWIEPKSDLGFLLLFDADYARVNIRRGYLDTKRAFGDHIGGSYSFEKGSFSELHQRFQRVMQSLLQRYFPGKGMGDEAVRKRLIRLALRVLLTKSDKKTIEHNPAVACAEVVASVFRFSPLEVYTEKSFTDKLFAELAMLPSWDIEKIEDLPAFLQNITDERILAKLFYSVLCQDQENNRRNSKASVLAALAPGAFLAGFFCYLLRPEQKNFQ